MEAKQTRARPKEEIFLEHFGVRTDNEALDVFRKNLDGGTGLPWSSLTKMKLPYEAPSHPKLPTMSEIKQALKVNELGYSNSNTPVCKIGATTVKMGRDEVILHVSTYFITPCMSPNQRVFFRKPETSCSSKIIRRFAYRSSTLSMSNQTTLLYRTTW